MSGADARRWWQRPPWPPRSLAWVALAGLALPASVLTHADAVRYLQIALAVAALLLRQPEGQSRWFLDRALLWPLGAFFAWALVTMLWTPEPVLALRRWTEMAGLTAVTLAGCGAALAATPLERVQAARALGLGFAVALALLVADCYGEAAISRHLFEGVTLVEVREQAQRSLFLLGLAAFALASRPLSGPGGALRLLPLQLVLAVSLLLHHWTNVLAMVAALLLWGLASWHALPMRRLWVALLLAVVLVAPLQGFILQALGDGAWKPRELVVREQIWRFAAERALEKPLFGWGLEGSRAIANQGEETLRTEGGAIISNHPHNIPLQVWLELGLPGLALAGWALFRLKQKVRRPLAQAWLLYVLIFAVLSIGLWRPRWMAIVACGALLYCLLAPRGGGSRTAEGASIAAGGKG